MKLIKAPFIEYETLRTRAEQFLDEHHPSRELPIPIENIIEFKLGIEIIPIPGLQRQFDVDAFLSQDLKSITVDESVLEGRENRYRFSLAHELAHFLVHAEIYRELACSSVGDWISSRDRIPKSEYRWLEMHADNLAGLILVPGVRLKEHFDQVAPRYVDSGYGEDQIRQVIAMELAPIFSVSKLPVKIRIERDGLL